MEETESPVHRDIVPESAEAVKRAITFAYKGKTAALTAPAQHEGYSTVY
jgi:hypothetical protein